MNRTQVESSMLHSIGYEPGNQVLELEFNNGQVWQYQGVPKAVYDALMKADSRGSYARNYIIGEYPERRASSRKSG